jgi:hypothetical protein
MAMLLLGCVICRIERWPLSDYRVYANRHHYSKICVYRLASIDPDGNIAWLPREEMTASGTTVNRRFRHATRYDDGKEFAKVLDHTAQGVSDEARKKFQKVAVVRRTVEKATDGEFQIKNEVALAKSLHDEPAGESRVLQAWYEETNPSTVRR